MAEYEMVGNIDRFDLDSILEKEQRFREGFIAKKGPIAVVILVVIVVILGAAFLTPMSETINTANNNLTESWHKTILDLVPVIWILGLMSALAIIPKTLLRKIVKAKPGMTVMNPTKLGRKTYKVTTLMEKRASLALTLKGLKKKK